MQPAMLGPQPQWLVGPFSITSTNPHDANLTLANPFGTLRATANGSWTDVPNIPIGNGPGQARIVNAGLVQISNDLESMVNGGQFFLMVPIITGMSRDNITQFELEINYSYSYFTVRSACYYDVNLPLTVPQEQPVVIVDKLRHGGPGRDTLRTAGGNFNLTLHKRNAAGQLITGTGNVATFTVQQVSPLPQGTVRTYHTTANNQAVGNATGIITTGNTQITAANRTFIFRITETVAPGSYIGLSSPFYVRVTTRQEGGNFVANAPEIGTWNGTTFTPATVTDVSVQGNVINVTNRP
ncbi:MAG: hypothetical protein FWC79_03215, partial [Oscillospiraceae bacterium]|nr:hypothetical protein [Oscillospiraceae bacterium]